MLNFAFSSRIQEQVLSKAKNSSGKYKSILLFLEWRRFIPKTVHGES